MGFNLSVSRVSRKSGGYFYMEREDWFDIVRHPEDEAFYTWLMENGEYYQSADDFYVRPKKFVAAVVAVFREVPDGSSRLLTALQKMADDSDLWFHASH